MIDVYKIYVIVGKKRDFGANVDATGSTVVESPAVDLYVVDDGTGAGVNFSVVVVTTFFEVVSGIIISIDIIAEGTTVLAVEGAAVCGSLVVTGLGAAVL